MRIHIWPGIFHLACRLQNAWHDVINVGNNLEQGVLGHMLHSKLTLCRITGIRFTQNRVPKTWNHLASC